MFPNIIKFIVSIFLGIIAIVLFTLWLIFGTILLITLMLRLISLYTIALLNSFVSGNPQTQDYTKAIEDVIDMYLNTFVKIISMPSLPWKGRGDSQNNNLRALLPKEMKELKKSWAITIIVFLSYTFSFGGSIAFLSFHENVNLKESYELSIKKNQNNLQELNRLNKKYKNEIQTLKLEKIKAIEVLYVEKRYSFNSLARFFNTTPDLIEKVITDNNINRK